MADKQSHGKEGGFKGGRKLKMVKGRPKVLRKESLEKRQKKGKRTNSEIGQTYKSTWLWPIATALGEKEIWHLIGGLMILPISLAWIKVSTPSEGCA